MKTSKYNIVFDYDTTSKIIYNSFSNSLGIIENELLDRVNEGKALSEEEERLLVEGNFLIEDDVDELSILRCKTFACKYNTKQLGITIAPTLDCNFRCVYCFEKNCRSSLKMGLSVQNRILEYINQKIDNISSLTICWFGGEPLLAMDVIEDLSSKIIEMCDRKSINYSASIITNGYLLNEKNVKRLISNRVQSCQITLDGDKEQHDDKRYLQGGIGTFDKIIENIISAYSTIPQITVRVNTDKLNMNAAQKIKRIFTKHNCYNVIVYPSPIKNQEDCYNQGNCLSNIEFFEIERAYKNILNKEDKDRYVLSSYPSLRGNACCADNINSVIFGPDGAMYKCWSDIGKPSCSFGNIVFGTRKVMNEIRYIDYDPTNDSKCKECKYLPICLGGCPYNRINKYERCVFYDKFQSDIMKDIVQVLKE